MAAVATTSSEPTTGYLLTVEPNAHVREALVRYLEHYDLPVWAAGSEVRIADCELSLIAQARATAFRAGWRNACDAIQNAISGLHG